MKIVLNRCYGGFGLSDEACEWLIKNRGWKVGAYTKDGKYPDETTQLIRGETSCFGIYNINESAVVGEECYESDQKYRTHKDIIDVVEALGKAANGRCADLEVVEIPDGTKGEIDEYDGMETFYEIHNSW